MTSKTIGLLYDDIAGVKPWKTLTPNIRKELNLKDDEELNVEWIETMLKRPSPNKPLNMKVQKPFNFYKCLRYVQLEWKENKIKGYPEDTTHNMSKLHNQYEKWVRDKFNTWIWNMFRDGKMFIGLVDSAGEYIQDGKGSNKLYDIFRSTYDRFVGKKEKEEVKKLETKQKTMKRKLEELEEQLSTKRSRIQYKIDDEEYDGTQTDVMSEDESSSDDEKKL